MGEGKAYGLRAVRLFFFCAAEGLHSAMWHIPSLTLTIRL